MSQVPSRCGLTLLSRIGRVERGIRRGENLKEVPRMMKNWSHNAQRWTVPRVCQRESLKMQRKERWFRENFSPPFLWAFPWIAPNHMTSPGGIRLCLLSLCQTLCVYQLEKRKDFPCLPCKSEKCLLIPSPSIGLTCHSHAAKSSSLVLSEMITAKPLI